MFDSIPYTPSSPDYSSYSDTDVEEEFPPAFGIVALPTDQEQHYDEAVVPSTPQTESTAPLETLPGVYPVDNVHDNSDDDSGVGDSLRLPH